MSVWTDDESALVAGRMRYVEGMIIVYPQNRPWTSASQSGVAMVIGLLQDSGKLELHLPVDAPSLSRPRVTQWSRRHDRCPRDRWDDQLRSEEMDCGIGNHRLFPGDLDLFLGMYAVDC
jgi:hypothetical protein